MSKVIPTITWWEHTLKNRNVSYPHIDSQLVLISFIVLLFSCSVVFYTTTLWIVAHQNPVHGLFQARILEWVTIAYFRGSSRIRDGTWVFFIGRWVLYPWTTKAQAYSNLLNLFSVKMHIYFLSILTLCHFPGGTVVKNPPANSGNECSIPRSGRSPGGKNGNPLEYSYQENSMDRGAWKAVIHEVAQNWIQLSEHTLSTDNLFSSVQFSSVTHSCPTLCNPLDCSRPGFPVHQQLLEFTQTHVCWVGDAIQPSHSLSSLLLLPSNFASIRVFSNESDLRIRWPNYWSFSFRTSPSNKYSGLISLRMDWLDLLAVQRTLKSLLQQHSSKASILQCSAFFIVQF